MSKVEKFWENATADDVAEIANTRTPIPARVRDSGKDGWEEGLLAGWKLRRSDVAWIDTDGASWKQCQVYREPSWYADKPDPGPEYRLLEKFPDEPKLGTDEAWRGKSWRQVLRDDGKQEPSGWYRRRIEPLKPKFSVGQTVKVIGPKATDSKQWSEEMNKHRGKESAVSNREKKDDGWFYELGCSAIWAFREDYLEAVEPGLGHYALRVGDSASLPNGQTITITEKGFEATQ